MTTGSVAVRGDAVHRTLTKLLIQAGILSIAAIPFLVLSTHFSIPRFILLASTVSGSIVCVALVGEGAAWKAGPREVLGFVAGLTLVSGFSLSFPLLQGSTFGDLYESLWAGARRVASGLPVTPTRISILALPLTMVSLAGALLYRYRTRLMTTTTQSRFEHLLMWAKLGFSLWMFLYFVLGPHIGLTNLLAPGVSMLWLAVVDPSRNRQDRFSGGILILAFISALQTMQVYPITGSQCAVATILTIPLSILCFHDFFLWVHPQCSSIVKRLPGIYTCKLCSFALVLLFTIYQTAPRLGSYLAAVPIPAEGASWVRVPSSTAGLYGYLITVLKTHGRPFVSTVGFNSLHRWSGLEARTPVVIGNSLNVFSPTQLLSMVRELESHPDSIVLHHPGFFPDQMSGTNLYLRHILDNYEIFDSRDSFQLMYRKGQTPPNKADQETPAP
jgi:hypothetical protein